MSPIGGGLVRVLSIDRSRSACVLYIAVVVVLQVALPICVGPAFVSCLQCT